MSLNLGKEYLENTRASHHRIFQDPQHEVTEAMTGHADVPRSHRATTAVRRKYMLALDKYNSLEKQIQEETIRAQIRLTEIQPYLGKRARQPNGDVVYVNDYGYTTAYVDSAATPSTTCNKHVMPIPTDKMEFLKDSGRVASPAMPCGVAGKNVQDEDTEETAWVDVKGRKHVYSDAVWRRKQEACNVLPVLLSSHEYRALPEGSPMQSSSPCLGVDVDLRLWRAKERALDRLMQLTAELEAKTKELEIQDAKLNEVTRATRLLRVHVDNQQRETRAELATFEDQGSTREGELESTQLVLVSRRLQLLVWMLVCVTVIAVIAHALASGTGKLGGAVLLAVCLLLIYGAARSLWRWAANY